MKQLSLFVLVAVFSLTGCSDPSCGETKIKIGDRCEGRVTRSDDGGSEESEKGTRSTRSDAAVGIAADAGATMRADARILLENESNLTDGGGASGTGADAALESGPHCAQEGAMRCGMPGTALRETCSAGMWIEAAPCSAGAVCDPKIPDTCRELLAACVGNAGKTVCDGATMISCDGSGGVSSSATCMSERLCRLGEKDGVCRVCEPNVFRCSGAKLERCDNDGSRFTLADECESAALCNEADGNCGEGCTAGSKLCLGDTLRACSADRTMLVDEATCGAGLCDASGKQCDVCQPGAKACDGNVVRTCNAQGQGYTMQACAGARPLCTGDGICVECSTTSPCKASTNPCEVATCDLAAGTCATSRKPAGSTCVGGVCDSAGACVECVDNGDCTTPGRGVCQNARCVAPPRCGDGNVDQGEECDDSNANNSDSCVMCKKAFCGDGHIDRLSGENCDVGMETTNAYKCDPTTCRARELYVGCTQSMASMACGGATGDGYCGYGYCSPACPNGTNAECPRASTKDVPLCSGGSCVLGCTTSADCPDSTFRCAGAFCIRPY